MSLKVLIAPDKFKGTLTAPAAAAAIARGWRNARPQDELTLLPTSDGGDGFGEVIGRLIGAVKKTVKTVDAAHRRCIASWWWESKTKTAVIESANVVGLAMLPPRKFHPFKLDTSGLGAVLRAAVNRRARRCLIGIGGSATNDGGFGLARALGWKFLNRAGGDIERWTALHQLADLRAPKPRRWFHELSVAVDVQNPLLGRRGATRVYGPQKGLRPEDFLSAERNLKRLAALFSTAAATPGAGAAGGLGFGLIAFLGAKPEPGFALFARLAELDRHLRRADLVVTGEGCIDSSTFMGKGAGELARRCRQLKTPCFGLAGTTQGNVRTQKVFNEIHALTDLASVAQAKASPALWLERLAEQTAATATRNL